MTLTKKQFKKYMFIALFAVGAVFLIALFLIGKSETLTQPNTTKETQVKNFTINGVNGINFTYTSKTPLIVTSMATWCSSCIQNSIHLNTALKESARSDIQVIAISIDPTDSKDRLVKFQSEFVDDSWLVVPISSGEPNLSDIFAIKTIDQSIIVDREGNIVSEHSSKKSVDQWKNIISKI